MNRKPDSPKNSNALLLFTALVLSLALAAPGCIDEEQNQGGPWFEGVTIFYYKHESRNVDLEQDLGLNDSQIARLEESSLGLEIRLGNLSTYHPYRVNSGSADVWNRSHYHGPGLSEQELELNHSYELSFHFVVNSTDQELQNLSAFGVNNYINLSLLVSKEWEIVVTPDPEIEHMKDDLISYRRGNDTAFIWLFRDPAPSDPQQGRPGHFFAIKILISYA